MSLNMHGTQYGLSQCYVVDFQPFWPQVFRKITNFKMTIFLNSILL